MTGVYDPPMQSRYVDDMWKFLACHIALNQATGKKAREVMPEFFSRFPDYRSVNFGALKEMIEILTPLGLQNSRADRLIKLAAYLKLHPDLKGIWRLLDREDIEAMPGMGKYAADSYMCFVLEKHDLEDYEEPLDKEIKTYLEMKWREHFAEGTYEAMKQEVINEHQAQNRDEEIA